LRLNAAPTIKIKKRAMAASRRNILTERAVNFFGWSDFCAKRKILDCGVKKKEFNAKLNCLLLEKV
jgi:hypothetical protein